VNQAVMVETAIARDSSVALNRFTLPVAQLALLGAGYFLAARLGLEFRFQNSQIGVVWPGSAVLVSALLLTPRSSWWLVLAVVAPIHAAVMLDLVPVWRWAWQIAGNSVFALLTVEALRRVAREPLHFGSRRQVLVFMGVCFALSWIYSFTTPSFVRSLLGFEAVFEPHMAVLRTTLTNATAILLVTPPVLLWAKQGPHQLSQLPTRQALEVVLIVASTVAASLVAFGAGPEIVRFPSLLLLTFLPLLWTAVRYGPLGASTAMLCVAALSIWGTGSRLGPFVMMTDADKILSLHLFWILMWVPIMLLAATIRERDVAEEALHRQRNQLAHVTRSATVGELSGALAHELRQPLMSILANAQAAIRLLSQEQLDLPEVRRILEDIAQDDKHAASVIGRLRSFMKDGKNQFEPLAVESVVRDTLALGHSAVELSKVKVELDIPADLPRVRGDPVQLLQVLLNLVVNGCEAMSRIPPPERRLTLRATPQGGKFVELLVADSGTGLPKGEEDRVFEPFFTTKGNGLGLGLSICRSIVMAHGGRLWGENNPERGATFHLMLHTEGSHDGNGTVDRGR
jgi:signal transduction histidine kinase